MRRGPRPTGQDYSYDQVWDSEGQVTRDGWMALMAIPFRSLRFRPDGSDWGVVFGRNFPRNSETDIWPRIAANISGILTQEATLNGIRRRNRLAQCASQSICAGAE